MRLRHNKLFDSLQTLGGLCNQGPTLLAKTSDICYSNFHFTPGLPHRDSFQVNPEIEWINLLSNNMKKKLSHGYVGTEVNKTTPRKVIHYKNYSFKSTNILKTQNVFSGSWRENLPSFWRDRDVWAWTWEARVSWVIQIFNLYLSLCLSLVITIFAFPVKQPLVSQWLMPFIKLACKVYDKIEDCIFHFLHGHEVRHLKLSVIALWTVAQIRYTLDLEEESCNFSLLQNLLEILLGIQV